ncbi:transmembrane protein 254-like isoform X2 [Branchiostoma floridae]|uniref:Transmembrane protein 254 n=1 Tax=Branchiostoma floridae TaxID=7739 RepID=A0A9J7N8L7_BRAFL|nr:transmembrane protein 254-like isoform X1 [Branchiostoma floridae]XP_035693711.1 transmembrane protein 254-like isoform X2 [Branchiostoma floridae]
MAAPMAGGEPFFRRASPFWMSFITVGFTIFGFAVYAPQSVPWYMLGPVGTLTQHLIKNYPAQLYKGFWVAWGIHTVEAVIAAILTGVKNIGGVTRLKWIVQTQLFGLASLYMLILYKPKAKAS